MKEFSCHGPWGPWLAMGLSYSGHIKSGCCEFKGSPLLVDLTKPLDIPSIWNGEWFQGLRMAIRDGCMVDYGCRGCHHMKQGLPELPEKPGGINEIQWANYAQAHEDRVAMNLTTEAVPMMYNICFTPRCNIKCIMCSQQDSREHAGRDEFSCELLMDNVEALSRASSILISGGEPFVSRECLKFLDQLCSHPNLLDVEARIVTNGLLLDKVMPKLLNKRRVNVHVSLDGVGDVYEYVRRGASWKRVSGNIERFLELKQKHGLDNWHMTVNCVLMKSTVLGLPDFIRWNKERGITFNLNPLMSTRESFDEDLVNNKRLMLETDGIEEAIAEAEGLLAQPGSGFAEDHFKTYMRSVRKGSKIGKLDISGAKSFEQFLESGELKGKRVAIWGTGTNYRYCYEDWLNENQDFIEFIGFVDNNDALWGTEIDGHPVYPPGELPGLAPEYLFIATQIVWRDEILQQIADYDCANMKIY